ncbi:hypothetical protein [Burkholderia sp. Bp8963]|uniref:hypothetical protein n=1 Tax=Burkholderia sp. Bp8963 TaxID=2184547 RepID=UPI001C8916A6|nr:hypothetical protein [Burkholderia sp. Bp8963]
MLNARILVTARTFRVQHASYTDIARCRHCSFATTVTLQDVSPFVFQEQFRLALTSFDSIGLLLTLLLMKLKVTVRSL